MESETDMGQDSLKTYQAKRDFNATPEPPGRRRMKRRARELPALVAALVLGWHGTAQAQQNDPVANPEPAVVEIDVEPGSSDEAIEARLERILSATPWFQEAEVEVDEGIVYLRGTAGTEEQRDWADRIASNTSDVVAVINDIEVASAPLLDLSPAWAELQRLLRATVRHAPIVAIAIVIALLTLFVGRRSVRVTSSLLERRLGNPLLREVASRLISIPIFLLGIYFVLSVLGLTGLAITIIGGTGLAGLVLGFAFRDIAENFLASVLLSMQKPFATGDFIEVAGHEGFVQSVNTRSTLLMTREGNHIQIPNAAVYKNTITNFTANPLARYDFVIGIGYDDSIEEAQEIAREVLSKHPAISENPEPLVLVQALGAATVNLRAYFWIDVTTYSYLKVSSAAIRLTKQAFDGAGISMPDEAREVVFPDGVPVSLREKEPDTAGPAEVEPKSRPRQPTTEPVRNMDYSVSAEGELKTDADEIDDQARRARTPEGRANLLED